MRTPDLRALPHVIISRSRPHATPKGVGQRQLPPWPDVQPLRVHAPVTTPPRSHPCYTTTHAPAAVVDMLHIRWAPVCFVHPPLVRGWFTLIHRRRWSVCPFVGMCATSVDRPAAQHRHCTICLYQHASNTTCFGLFAVCTTLRCILVRP